MTRRIKHAVLVGVTCVGLTLGAVGAGAGIASAEPGPNNCGPQNCFSPGGFDNRGPGGPGGPNGPGGPGGPGVPNGPGVPQGFRGIDQGRFDHQPFSYNGQWVTPVFRPELPQPQWGFWLFGVWIPL